MKLPLNNKPLSCSAGLVHNHPSGDPSPSKQDIALTRELIAALKPLGVQLHDHLIVGSTGTASLRGQGLI